MNADLTALEEKVTLLLNLCQELRRDNLLLRQQNVALLADANALKDKMQQAEMRLLSLIDQIDQQGAASGLTDQNGVVANG